MRESDVPTATEAYAFATHPLREYFVDLLLLALIWIGFATVAGTLRHVEAKGAATLYETLVMVPLNFGALYAYLRAARGERPVVRDLFAAFRSAYLQTVLAHILFVALVGAGFVLLIVPGFIVATRLAFVGFLVVDEEMDAVDAIKESWRRTEGYAGRIFVLWLLAIPITIGGLLLLGVGIVPAGIWIHLAFATMFADVTASEGDTPNLVAAERAGI